MFSSRFESLSKLPKPFGLFDKTPKDKIENQDEADQDAADQPKGTIREGLTSSPAAKDPKSTDDVPPVQTFLAGILVAVFCILFVIVGMIYYFNSSILLTKDLMAYPYYTKTNYWTRFKGKMVASRIFIFLILWMIVFCLNLLLMDTVFKNHEYDNIFYVTTIYYWSIVGSTVLLIGNIPSLVDVFENTLGYTILNTPLFNLSGVMSMFKSRSFKSKQIKIPYDFLITTFNIPSFHDYFQELFDQYPSNAEYNGTSQTELKDNPKSDFYIDLHTWLKSPEIVEKEEKEKGRPDTNPVGDKDSTAVYARRELLKCVLTKNTIGHFTWTLLASYIVILLTVSTVVQ